MFVGSFMLKSVGLRRGGGRGEIRTAPHWPVSGRSVERVPSAWKGTRRRCCCREDATGGRMFCHCCSFSWPALPTDSVCCPCLHDTAPYLRCERVCARNVCFASHAEGHWSYQVMVIRSCSGGDCVVVGVGVGVGVGCGGGLSLPLLTVETKRWSLLYTRT